MYKARDQIKDIKYVSDICERHSYPLGAFDALKKAYESIIACPEAAEAFFGWIDKYEENGLSDDDCKNILSDTAEASVKCGESSFTVHLLLLTLMSPHLHKLYRDAGIDDTIFYDSLCDLKWKLNECLRMHGIVGTFVANWQLLFYRMKIFSIGRLQYEPSKFGKEFTVCGVELTPEDDVLSVHIPASGKLIHEECLESYALAEKFFSKMFEGRNTVFVCNSWLLFPEHKVMLPEGSRIRAFSEDYTVVEARYSAPGTRPWPIFYEKKNAPADQLPESTALERAYTERYKKGLPSGSAYGVIIFKDGKILNTEKDKMA